MNSLRVYLEVDGVAHTNIWGPDLSPILAGNRATLTAATGLAKVAELADAPDLGSGSRKAMGVRVPPFAPASARRHERRPGKPGGGRPPFLPVTTTHTR